MNYLTAFLFRPQIGVEWNMPDCLVSFVFLFLSFFLSLGSDTTEEIARYLAEPAQPRLSDPLVFWMAKALIYPNIAQIAKIYLSAPPTSVPCERIFSIAGDIITEERNRLSPEKAEKLLFIKQNFLKFI